MRVRLIHVAILVCTETLALIVELYHLRVIVLIFLYWHHLSHYDVPILDQRVYLYVPARIQFAVVGSPHRSCFVFVRTTSNLLVAVRLLVLVLFGVKYRRMEQTSIDATSIHNNRILLIVARVCHYRHDHLLPRWDVVQPNQLHQFRIDQRTRRIVQHVRCLVHALVVVCHIHAHRLLTHGALIRQPRRLVVLRVRYARRQHAEDCARVYLAVAEIVSWHQIVLGKSDVRHGLLLGVYVLYHRMG